MNKVTKEFIDSQIKHVQYVRIPDTTVTVCAITVAGRETAHGFTVTGTSACIDPSAFDEELGQQYAYEDAYKKFRDYYGFMFKYNNS